MIALGMSHQTSHKVFGHYIIHNVTKFENCTSNKFFMGRKSSQKHFDKSNNSKSYGDKQLSNLACYLTYAWHIRHRDNRGPS